jgi:hypothetical protein
MFLKKRSQLQFSDPVRGGDMEALRKEKQLGEILEKLRLTPGGKPIFTKANAYHES